MNDFRNFNEIFGKEKYIFGKSTGAPKLTHSLFMVKYF